MIEKKHFIITILVLIICVSILSCVKDDLTTSQILTQKISSNSRTQSGALELEVSIAKKLFDDRKMEEKLTSKLPNFTQLKWNPNWDNPITQVINDSTFYLIFPMIPYITDKGVTKSVVAVNNNYLFIKNSTEFYFGTYDFNNPLIIGKSNPNNETSLEFFTGKFSMTNIETKQSINVNYENGILKKKDKITVQKSDMVTQGNVLECHDVLYCTYGAVCDGTVYIHTNMEGCTAPNSDQGVGTCTVALWQFKYSETRQVCQYVYYPDLPDLPGDGGGGDNGGGGGSTPDSNPEAPCNLGKQLQNDATFKNLMNDLKSKTSSNREYAHVQTTSGSWSMYEGPQNGSGIDNLPGTGVKAIIHSHYNDPNMLSIFSTADIRALHQMAFGGGFGNTIADAYIGVVTPNLGGTAYLLSISDINKFAAKNDEIKGIIADNLYNALIKPSQSNTLNESGFLKIIEGWGLTLLKTDYNDISYWGTIKPDGVFGTKLISCW